MGFIEEVFKLADELNKKVEERDIKSVKEIKKRQAILWANATDENLKSYAPYQAKRFPISEKEAFLFLKNIRSLHQKRLQSGES